MLSNKREGIRLKDKDFIYSLKKLYNMLSQKNLLNKQQQEDFINDIEDLEEVSSNMHQLMNKKITDFYNDYLNLVCNLNPNILDIGADVMEISELLDSINKRIKK